MIFKNIGVDWLIKKFPSIKRIEAYIKNRNRVVDLKRLQFKPLIKSLEILQGLILGPSLFILFIKEFSINK